MPSDPIKGEKPTEAEAEAILHVLGYYSHKRGHQPGSFTTSLLDTYHKADPTNRARLKQGFPELITAMDYVNGYRHRDLGLDVLAAVLDINK